MWGHILLRLVLLPVSTAQLAHMLVLKAFQLALCVWKAAFLPMHLLLASIAPLARTAVLWACPLAHNVPLAASHGDRAQVSVRTAQLGFTAAHLALHLAFHVLWAPSQLSLAHPNVQTAWLDPTVVALV